jgi:hypothetical protein
MKIYVAAALAACVVAAPAALVLSAPAALAQSMVPNGQSGPEVQPKAPTPDFAPPAIPGAGPGPGIATAPKVAKVDNGDPTTELFDAVNKGDYAAAQDAISRGANLDAQNALGETPLDLAISLNQNSLTFLILSARNETGEGGAPAPVVAQQQKPARIAHAQPAAMRPAFVAAAPRPMPVAGNDTGTPNAGAGFLGFGPKS